MHAAWRRTAATIRAGHAVYRVALSADWLAWVEQWYGPRPASTGDARNATFAIFANTPSCPNYGQPLEWRVMAALRDGGPPQVVAHGANVRGDGECGLIPGPGLALSGDRIAWTAEAATKGHPDATRLSVSSLATGRVARQVTFDGAITGISLDGQALLFGEQPSDGTAARVLFAADDAHALSVILDAANGAVGGGRIAWASDAADGSVWTAPEGSLDRAIYLRAPVDPGFISREPDRLVVDSDAVAWEAQGLFGDVSTSRVVVWRSGWATPRLLTGYSQPDMLQLAGGWLAWDSTLGWMDGPAPGWYRAPASAVP